MLTSNKRKIFILVCLIALVSAVLGVVFSSAASGDATSIQGALTDGRAFEKAEKLELQRDLESMPKTYEAVLYVPKDKKQMGVIFGNYIRESISGFAFRISAAGKPELQIIDNEKNVVVNTFDYDIRGEAWVHVAITHEVLDDGALFSCYVNGKLIGTNRTGKSYELDMTVAQSAVTPYLGKDFRNEYYFKGRIKDLALYTEALSADEIAASFNNGVGTHKDDLLALYDLSDADGASYIADLTGGGYDFVPQYFEREEEKTDYEYSFAIIGDTQYLIYRDTYYGTSHTSNIYNWIVQNKNAKNIQFVMGLGDITDKNGVDKTASDGIDQTNKEWMLAVSEYQKLTAAGIPYSVVAGNHDSVPQLDKFFAGNSNFSALDTEHFEGESLGNYCVKFTVGETKYMVMCLDYCPEAGSAEMIWANKVIEQNPNHKVIITTHYNLNSDATRYGDIWDSLVTYNKNVIMVISGHINYIANTIRKESVGAAGHKVLELLVDPQYIDTNYGYNNVGMVGMLYFSEDGSKVDFEYISTQATLANQSTDSTAQDVFYGHKNQFSYTIADEPETVVTKYGTITDPAWADPTAYPFVLFDESGNCIGAAPYLYGTQSSDSAITQAIVYLGANKQWTESASYEQPHSVTILMRADHSLQGQYYDNISHIRGLVTIDLNGYTLSATTGSGSNDVLVRSSHKNVYNTTELVFKNGKIALFNNPVLSLSGISKITKKQMKYGFENIDFTVNGSASKLIAKYGTSTLNIYPEITLTDCNIDISGSTAENITLFDVGDALAHTTITVNGGNIITGGKAFTIFGKTNDATEGKLIFGEYKGAYTSLTLPEGAVPPSGDFGNGETNLIFAKYGTEDSTDIYRLTYEYVNTKYGIIPAEYTFTDKYPFVVFDENGNCIGGSNNFYTVVGNAKTYLAYNAYNGESYTYEGGAARQAIILMRCDHSIGSTLYFDNISQTRGTITVDLDGYTLTRSGSDALMRSSMKAWGATQSGDGRTVFPTEIVFTNGSIELKDGALAKYTASAEGKELTYRYININFSITGAASTFAATHTVEDDPSVFGLKPEMYFENCVIDITRAKKETVLFFNLGDETTCLDVYLNGCEIKALGTAFTLFGKGNESSTGSFTISDSDGANSTLTLPLGTAAPKISGIKFVKLSESADTVTYAMTIAEPIETKYGVIPAEYTDYTFVIFSNGEYKGGSDLFSGPKGGIIGEAANITVVENPKAEAQIVMLKDYIAPSTDYYDNLAACRTTITVDLNGNTFYAASDYMFRFTPKKNNDPTNIKLINGNVVLANTPVARLGTGTADFASLQFTLTCEDVNFSLKEGSTLKSMFAGYAKSSNIESHHNFVFKGCVFDITNATAPITLFDANDPITTYTTPMEINYTLSDCKIKAKDTEFTLFAKDNEASDSSFVISNSDGVYNTLTLPTGVIAPEISGIKFVRVAESADTVTYAMILAGIESIDFTPRTSITLCNALIYNVYVPVNSVLKSFTLDGVTYTDFTALTDIVTIGANDYYHFAIELPSPQAARDIVLLATVTVNGADYNGKWTMSIPKYARAVLESPMSTVVEKTLVKDVLAYVKAAYSYFTKFNTAEEIERVNALIESVIGNYSVAPVSSGVVSAAPPATAVTLNLDAKPSIRFYVTDTTVEFYANGKKLDTVTGTDEVYGAYVELDVYAYVLAQTITYGEGGSYHISSFVKGAVGTDHEELVKAFVKYVESSAEYRDSVIGEICEDGKCADGNVDHYCDVCGVRISICADDDSDHKCDTCGTLISNHSFTDWRSVDAVNHERECLDCGENEMTEHSFDNNADDTCDCGYVRSIFAAEVYDNNGYSLNYRVYTPSDLSAENKRPLILFLHGAGERGNDNEAQLTNAILKVAGKGEWANAIILAPQCPTDTQWVATPWANGNYQQSAVAETDVLNAVANLVKSYAENDYVDTSRIYAIGLSMGGFGTWDIVSRHSDLFAAAVMICGGGPTDRIDVLKDIPIYTFHGTEDPTVPYRGTEEMYNAIVAAGENKILFHTFEGAGHRIWDQAITFAGDGDSLPSLESWLFAQKK